MGQEDSCFELPVFLEGLPTFAFHLKCPLVALVFVFFFKKPGGGVCE